MVARIRMVSIGPPVVKRAAANRMISRSLRNLGAEWHKKFRRPHFTQAAFSRYGYTRRSKAYNRVKKKNVGHTIPLVLSGRSRSLSETKKIRATKNSVTVSMPVRVLNFKTKGSKVDKRKEFETPADFEVETLNNNAVRDLEKRYRRYEKRTELL